MASAKLNKEEISKIAYLSRLQLTDQEIEAAAGHLSDILGHFSAIQDIDTAGIPTADAASDLKNVTRPDTANATDLADPAAVLASAPKVNNDQIQVPAIF